MRKFLSFISALVISCIFASAQTVEKSGLFENTYVTVSGGVTTNTQFGNMTKDNWFKVSPVVGLEFGKYVTPVIGFSVEGLGFIETTNSRTFFDESAVIANGKLNFSNWFGGYKGQPRRVEVVGVLGHGWGHDYVASSSYGQYRSSEKAILVDGHSEEVVGVSNPVTDKDYTVYKAGAELNFNLGKARAWQINVRPSVIWFHKTAGQYVSTPFLTTGRDARANVMLGLTYKFGSKSKGHNFRLCPYSVTQEDYDALLAENEELIGIRQPEVKEVVKTVVEEKAYIVKETRVLVGSTIITFPIGSCELSSVERAKVDAFAKSLDSDTLIQVVGSADSKTGSETRNFALAQNRANVVKNILVNDYGISPDRISVNTKIDITGNPELDRSATLTLSVE